MRGEDPSSSSSTGEVNRVAGLMVVVEVSIESSERMSLAAFHVEVGSERSGATRVSGNSSSKRWIMR